MKKINKEIKIIAVDVDGTLYNDMGKISSKTKKALIQAQKEGVKVVLCTGRFTDWLYPIAKKIHIDKYSQVVIGANGAEIKNINTNKYISKNALTIGDTNKIIALLDKYAKNNNFCYAILSDNHSKIALWNSKESLKWCQEKSYCNKFFKPSLLNRDSNISANHFIIISQSENTINKIKEYINKHFPKLKISTTIYGFYSITFQDVNKWTGILEYLQYLKKTENLDLDHRNIMAFGDEMNDYEMIKNSKYGIVMKNGNKELKMVAFDVTDSNNNNGIVNALFKHLFYKINK